MNPGSFDRRIRIEYMQVTQETDYGTQVPTWLPLCQLAANIKEELPSKGEVVANGLKIARRTARIRTRYVSGITSDMRVVLLDRDNRLLQILTQPVELGRKAGLEFMVVDYTTQAAA
jgi:SPP1 family predicted phage head-tail adaptor